MTEKETRVAVIGMGHVGCPLAAVIAARGFSVTGIDVQKNIVEGISAGDVHLHEEGLSELVTEQVSVGNLVVSTDFALVTTCDVILVTVGTPLSETGEADLSAITSVCGTLAPHLWDGQIVVLKSTVPPGFTKNQAEKILSSSAEVHVAFSPERLAEGTAIQDIRSTPLIVGGTTDKATLAAQEVLGRIIGVECIPVSNATEAEMAKLADNLWIDVNIALANELAKVSDSLGIDVLQVIKAANTLKKGSSTVNILMPSLGVGGSCLTKDPLFFENFATEQGIGLSLPGAGRSVNDSMPLYSVARIKNALAITRAGSLSHNIKVCVLGIAFKSDTSAPRTTRKTAGRQYQSRIRLPLLRSQHYQGWSGAVD